MCCYLSAIESHTPHGSEPGASIPQTPSTRTMQTAQNSPSCFLTPSTAIGISPILAAVRHFLAPETPEPTPRSRCVTKTRILTANEFMEEVKRKDEEKNERDNNKKARQAARQAARQEKESGNKKRPQKQTGGNKRKKRKQLVSESDDDPDSPSSDSGSDSDSEDKCGVCNRSFRRDSNGEQWIQCLDCKEWFHMSCVNQTVYDPEFKCEDCLPLVKR